MRPSVVAAAVATSTAPTRQSAASKSGAATACRSRGRTTGALLCGLAKPRFSPFRCGYQAATKFTRAADPGTTSTRATNALRPSAPYPESVQQFSLSPFRTLAPRCLGSMFSSLVKVGSLADFRDQERVLLVFKKVPSELERTDAKLMSQQQQEETEEKGGGSEEVFVLFNPGLKGELFCMEATCPHSGGPLELGDIEDIGGEQCVSRSVSLPGAFPLTVVCPWHDYDFGLRTGLGTTHDLQACTLRVTVKDGEVLVDAPGRKLVSIEGCPLVPSRRTASGAAVPEPPPTSLVRESVNMEDNSLCYWTYRVLETRNPVEKVAMTKELYQKWMDRKIALGTQRRFDGVPPRDQQMQDAWSGKNRGKGGTMVREF
ncbi:MAG: hypothetical protein BJ554DRAFT_1849 [Olpidium bornovanus]|uniref:Rieske domain-containing protein n=1 Tax=Olpidium bornovanus TaxID=278681 RepID=A0A8H7ZRR1_9FUNG|nr:MAG: hypothetical protein BJ554DRAFT_1849 [Olpidium bornovanus]